MGNMDNTVNQGPNMADKTEEKTFLKLTKGGWIKLTVFLALVVAIVVAFAAFGLHKKLEDILEWMDDNPVPGFFIFACLYVLAAVLFIPGLILSVGSGFVFGLYLGTLAVFVGATIGQTVAFLVGRYLLRDWISKKTQGFTYWQAVEAAVSTEGWKIVGLLRLAPLVPYNALNYALGLTSVKFWHYFFSSAFGILPGTLLYVYLGSVAADISAIASGDAVNGTVFIITAVVTGVVIVLVVVLTTYYAKRAIKQKLDLAEEGENQQNAGGENAGGAETNEEKPNKYYENSEDNV